MPAILIPSAETHSRPRADLSVDVVDVSGNQLSTVEHKLVKRDAEFKPMVPRADLVDSWWRTPGTDHDDPNVVKKLKKVARLQVRGSVVAGFDVLV